MTTFATTILATVKVVKASGNTGTNGNAGQINVWYWTA